MSIRSSDPTPGLLVSLKQGTSGAAASPLTVIATVTNTNDRPVTILDYDSPLDSLALQLGLLKITPDGASEPLDLPIIQVRRIWPPSEDSLITIPAGGSAENEIILEAPLVNMGDLKGEPSVLISGQSRAVYDADKGEVSAASLDDPSGSDDAFTWNFESDSLVLRLP